MVTYGLMMTGIVSVVFEADAAKFSVVQVSSIPVMSFPVVQVSSKPVTSFPAMHVAMSFSLEVTPSVVVCPCLHTGQ